MTKRKPKVFISYSWTVKTKVLELAKKLADDGVNVIIDEWYLKPGHNKYAFMEQCVTNKSIKRVIIICDKSYAEKADKLVGGVGDETIIISPKIYKNTKQEKFIPVVIEKNNSGEAYLPTYLSPNIYIDLTGKNYEENYTKLKEAIFGSSTKVKTQIDNHPRTEEATPISYLKKAIKKLTHNINDITARDWDCNKVCVLGFLKPYKCRISDSIYTKLGTRVCQ